MKWIAILALCALLATAALAQEAEPTAPEEIVEQILELQRRIEELMAALPPEVRAELRRRLAEAPSPVATAAPAETAVEPAVTATEVVAPIAEAVTEPTAETAEPAVVEPATETAVEAIAETATAPETHAGGTPAPQETAPAVPTAAAAPSAAPAATAPPSGEGLPRLIRRRSKRPPCNTLRLLDENGDGIVSSADRYWRYLYIWSDKNGDGQIQEREVASAYDRKIREIAVSLETFARIKGGLGEARVEDRIVLDLRGDGFNDRARRDDGVLAVDAGALARGDGPRLLGAGGEVLEGFVAFRAGLRLEISGQVTELNCP